jgi:NDP-sugar pyrophosphorylase family protein
VRITKTDCSELRAACGTHCRTSGSVRFVVNVRRHTRQEPIREMLDRHLANDAVATLAVHEAESIEGKGTIDVDAHGRVTGFVEKSPKAATSPALINFGHLCARA